VSEIREGQVEEVDEKEELGEPEVVADPEVNEAEEEEVVGDVVRANVCGGSDVDCVFGIEGPGVDELEGKKDYPVDGGDDAVLGKGSGDVVTPYCVTWSVVLALGLGPVEGVIEGRDDEEEIGYEGGDAVDNESLRGVLLAAGEGVVVGHDG